MKICNALASLASFTETISIFNQPDQITNFKCLIYSVDRVLKQLNLAELTCIQKCRLAAPLYPFPSLCFCTIWSLNFRTILSKDSFADCTPKFLALKRVSARKLSVSFGAYILHEENLGDVIFRNFLHEMAVGFLAAGSL